MDLSPTTDEPPASGASGRHGPTHYVRRVLAEKLAGSGLAKLGMQWRFRAVVLAFAVPFLGYIVWGATEQAAIEKAHASDRAQAHAVLIASRLDDYVVQTDRLLEGTAPSLARSFADPPALSALIQGLRGRLPKAANNVVAWSLGGTSVASLDPRSGLKSVDVTDRAYFREALDRLDLAIQGPILSRGTGDRVVVLARPVLDAQGKRLGVVSITTRLEDLIAEIDPNGFVSNRSLISIVDRDGTMVARSVDGAFWIGKNVARADRLRAGFARQTGAGEEVGVDGRLRLSGYQVASKLPWMVIVGEPLETAIAPVSQRLFLGLGIGLVCLVLAMLVAGRTARWTIRPVMQLAADADRLGAGDLAHRSAVTSGGEIAALAANFNLMAAALQEREAELAAHRAQLRAITDNVPQQIIYLDRDERYRFVNAHRGPFPYLDAAVMIGRTVREVRGEEIYEGIAPSLHLALGGEAHAVERTTVIGGRVVHYHVTYVPDYDANGAVCGVYGFVQDITERKTAELLRAESERRLVTITDNLPAMICYVDDSRRFRFANRAVGRWFDRPVSEVVGQTFVGMLPPEIARQYDHHFIRCMLGERCEYEVEVPARDGTRWLRCTFIPDVDDATGKVRGIYGMMHNVTAAKAAEHRLTRLAEFDTLTGLANRHQFNETLRRTLEADDADPAPLALMFLDIDHFKQINDRYGHAGGDALLKEFAQRLTGAVRQTDAVARLSGDEFVVLLSGLHTDDEPQFIARKILAAVEKTFEIDGHFMHVTSSIGIALRSPASEASSSLMRRADEALYEAKRGGRNTFRMAG